MNDGHPADGKEKRFSSLLKLFGRENEMKM